MYRSKTAHNQVIIALLALGCYNGREFGFQTKLIFWQGLLGVGFHAFVVCISDGILTAYIPLLEVLPEYQGKGIGTKLVKLILEETSELYMIDISHDEDKTSFYARFGLHKGVMSFFRNYEKILDH